VRIHYYLEIDEETRKIKCLKCGHVICDATENYKLHVPRAEVQPSEITGLRPASDKALLTYYEYYCPNCYTMLDVEVMEKGSAPLWDIQVKV
jgi:acetone carboxylase gamma subunit